MSETYLFLCGVGVILMVVAAIFTMVSTIYQMAQRDEVETLSSEATQRGNLALRRDFSEANP